MDGLRGKNIWIIGASSGIGRALAHVLSERGANLLVTARRREELETLVSEMSGNHTFLALDISNEQDVQTTAQKVKDIFPALDSVIHLAALYDPSRVDQIDITKTRQLVDVNMMGTFNIVHAVLPILATQGFGQIALCGSVAGYRGLPNGQPYSATKAAIINLAETLYLEHPNLDVKLINPGFVRTPLTDKNDFAMPMMIEPEQAAVAIADGLTRRGFEIHFPKAFTRAIKLLRLLPYPLYFAIAKRFSAGEKK